MEPGCRYGLTVSHRQTELLRVGPIRTLSRLDSCLLTLQLGADIIVVSDHIRLLGVTISADLSFD